ncbi:hypothetical protein [Lacinutrix sp. MedPE-SW]|uniref:hypothetical protein n=1 Tax=Lacinutrix sp. MedPE-SW TaxID=1860087 RepID=UPI0025BE74AE|nr:hypothetical protein [Lacinutrix sp. MedPE-SW]
MNKQTLRYHIIIFIMLCVSNVMFSQSYKKDSLQIKAYTEIIYNNSKADSIWLKKVFCDYCNEKQLESIGQEALYRADAEKYLPENKLKQGKKRLAIYIRIAKKDFAKLKDNK